MKEKNMVVKKEEKQTKEKVDIKGWFTKHKSDIIVVLGALIAFFTSLEAFGGKAAVYCTCVVAFIELFVFYMKNGVTEAFLNMCVATIKMIVDVLNGEYTKEVNQTVHKETVDEKTGEVKTARRRKKVKVCFLNEKMIRDYVKNHK